MDSSACVRHKGRHFHFHLCIKGFCLVLLSHVNRDQQTDRPDISRPHKITVPNCHGSVTCNSPPDSHWTETMRQRYEFSLFYSLNSLTLLILAKLQNVVHGLKSV